MSEKVNFILPPKNESIAIESRKTTFRLIPILGLDNYFLCLLVTEAIALAS
jgi:hypothetical protein